MNAAVIDSTEWGDLAMAAGLSLDFTGDECQDAWEQLWHDRSAPGYEVRAVIDVCVPFLLLYALLCSFM